MAAPVANDRKLAAEVRNLTLNKIKKLFELTDLNDKERILHEHTGDDGGAVIIQLSKEIANKNVIDPSPSDNSQEPSEIQGS